MFGLQYWTASEGWHDYWRVPADEDEAKSMLSGLRHTNPQYPWRAYKVLDL